MNIVRENIGNLNEHITVELAPADYQEAVEKTLKDLRRRANIPGFRAGHVPMGMIERQYKPSVMVDEISKLVNDNVEKYLKDNDIQIIFEPLAVTEKTKGDFTKGGDFSFTFEIGLRPEIVV
ncbi:MAG: trigger factor family protein, partial [Bacteroidales bacterium]|nr:trigger factor family protein [Bacteroidales bacterium]